MRKPTQTGLVARRARLNRLLSESEREYVARAGTTTPYWLGPLITTRQAHFDFVDEHCTGRAKSECRQGTVPVDSFAANPWGLFNVHGNVLEWTEDCYVNKNASNPGDGNARSGKAECSRVVRGGAFDYGPRSLRAAYRNGLEPESRSWNLGFRLARVLRSTR